MTVPSLAAFRRFSPAVPAPTNLPLCTVRRRLLAFALDTLGLSLCLLVGATVCWLVIGSAITFDLTQPGADNGLVSDAARVRVTTYVSTAISLCYFVGSWLTLGASPGQRLVGVRLYSASTGKPLSLAQALGRWVVLGAPLWIVATANSDALGAIFSLAALGWSVFLLASTARSDTKQGAHDRWTGSVLSSATALSGRNDRHLRLVKPHVD